MCTRADPAEDTEIVRGMWTGGIEPRLVAKEPGAGSGVMSRMTIDACRPLGSAGSFPLISKVSDEERARIMAKVGRRDRQRHRPPCPLSPARRPLCTALGGDTCWRPPASSVRPEARRAGSTYLTPAAAVLAAYFSHSWRQRCPHSRDGAAYSSGVSSYGGRIGPGWQ